ncbi:MAG: aldo/keto reductase [Bryobacterales bacterium]|nr:aldo/keto reductase [Bryobacterales bacterium]
MANLTRRDTLNLLRPAAMASTFLPIAGQYRVWSHPVDPNRLVTRPLGRTGREVTTFGLAGGNKVMWDLPGDEGVEIVVKAVKLGMTYLETANNYQRSQLNYHKAFRILNLIPGQPGYDHNLRGRLFLATKTGWRYSVIRDGSKPMGRSAGGGSTCIDDLKRSLTQFFGDGKGYIPEGAYIDLMQIHFLSYDAEVDAIFEGLENPSDKTLPRIGALAGLIDFRDGTNHTGVNPEHKKYIRHIGITGHENAAAHMYAIRRDTKNVLETLLVAINPNDRHYFCHQNNSVAAAAAKGMGIIGMKIFADGVMYGLEKKYASQPGQSVLSVGQKGKAPYQDFLEYSLSAPGVSTVIAGIGLIDKTNDPTRDQLTANLAACQLREPLTSGRRRQIEEQVAVLHGTDTNFFQRPACGLLSPQSVKVARDSPRGPVKVLWTTAYAAGEPMARYEIYRRDQKIAAIPYKPQLTEEPFAYTDAEAPAADSGGIWYKVRAVDSSGAFADSLSVKPV